jgi:hypothetical protein
VLALLANETGVLVFPLLFLTEVLVRAQEGGWRNVRGVILTPRTYIKYSPLVILLLAFLVVTFGGSRAYLSSAEYVDPRRHLDRNHFVGIGGEMVRDLPAYNVYLVLPQVPLRSLDPNVWTALISFLVEGGVGAILVFGTSTERYCALWMEGALLAYVLFVPFGNADRYSHLAAVGYSMGVGSLIARVLGRLSAVHRLPSLGWPPESASRARLPPVPCWCMLSRRAWSCSHGSASGDRPAKWLATSSPRW